MKRYLNHVFAMASIGLGLLAAAPARAASLTEVNRSDWTGGVSLPSYMKMYIYVPNKLATKPPILVSPHSCGNSASGQFSGLPKFVSEADAQGYIVIYPDNPGQNCWDVGSTKALTRDGGGDTHGVALMVKYALTKYSADASRVYIAGGSSGGMMTQAMLALYPDMFRAGMSRAGVPAGCWAVDYDKGGTPQWSQPCSLGQVTHTAQEWGDIVRKMNPTYTGHRPRVQLVHGDADSTIDYKNMGEAIKEWTNVLGLPTTPTSTDKYSAIASYNRQFWKNDCGSIVLEAWTSPGGTHSMKYEESDILKFLGLVAGTTSDPEPDCNGDGGVPSTGGVSGAGGGTGAGGATGSKDGGPDGRDGGGREGGVPGTGGSGTSATGGSTGSGGATGSGGSVASGGRSGSGGAAKGGNNGSGGTVASGGSVSSGGTSASGGSGAGGTQNSGGSSAKGGSSGNGGSSTTTDDAANGCNCAVGSDSEHSAVQTAMLLLIAVGLVFRRSRRPRR